MNVGRDGRNIVRVRFEKGLDLVLMVGEGEYMAAGYQINVYAKGGWRSVVPDLADLYVYLMEQFISVVKTGKEVLPIEESVEVIAALEAGERSLAEGREVTLAEVLA
jgi:predicted dehydrogenase